MQMRPQRWLQWRVAIIAAMMALTLTHEPRRVTTACMKPRGVCLMII